MSSALSSRVPALLLAGVLTGAALTGSVAIAAGGARWSGPALTATPMAAADVAAVDALVQTAMAQNPEVPGIWIGVWDPQKGVYTQAYGEAVKGGAKATVADHGRIGSVTKTFTTTAILQQVATGSLTLATTIADVLPDLAAKHPDIGAITVEQLVSMRSGIPDYADTGVVIKGVVADPSKVWTADTLIEAALTLPLAAPGTGGYSTTNTIILGKMLEKLTGMPVEQVITDVARQAGLTDSALLPLDVIAMPEPFSHGYVNAPGAASLKEVGADVAAGTDVTDWTPSWGGAGGGMYATVADLGRWAGTGLGTSLLPADLGAQRLVGQHMSEGDYGLGVFDWGQGWIGHTGQIIGWESIVAYDTKTGAAFVAMVNETGSLASALTVGISQFPDLIGLVGG